MVVSNGSRVVVAGGGCGWLPLVLSELVGETGEVSLINAPARTDNPH
jgi:tRNA A58 N-methylase Trm61